MKGIDEFTQVYESMIDIGGSRLSGKHTVEPMAWQDGSYQMDIFHTVAAYQGVEFRESLFYDSEEDEVVYREYVLHNQKNRMIVRREELKQS